MFIEDLGAEVRRLLGLAAVKGGSRALRLLLQGETQGADQDFRHTAELATDFTDGHGYKLPGVILDEVKDPEPCMLTNIPLDSSLRSE